MNEPRLIPLKTMTSDIVKVRKCLAAGRNMTEIKSKPVADLISLNGWSHSPSWSPFLTDAAVCGRESPENIGHLSAKGTECHWCVITLDVGTYRRKCWSSWIKECESVYTMDLVLIYEYLTVFYHYLYYMCLVWFNTMKYSIHDYCFIVLYCVGWCTMTINCFKDLDGAVWIDWIWFVLHFLKVILFSLFHINGQVFFIWGKK